MAIVTFHDVNKMFGTECVFDDLSLVLFEKEANHNGHRNVCTGGHAVINVGEAEFQEMLTKTMEALKAKGIEFNWHEK